MKCHLLSAVLLALVFAGGALAQQPATINTLPPVNVSGSPGERTSPGVQSVAPEVWVYMQERQRYEDPKQAVRRKAEARALARQGRLESRRWFGLSNARPTASATPFMDQYSPAWRGNGMHGYDWVGVGGGVAIYLDADTIRR